MTRNLRNLPELLNVCERADKQGGHWLSCLAVAELAALVAPPISRSADSPACTASLGRACWQAHAFLTSTYR